MLVLLLLLELLCIHTHTVEQTPFSQKEVPDNNNEKSFFKKVSLPCFPAFFLH
jgi:hypothetical protein